MRQYYEGDKIISKQAKNILDLCRYYKLRLATVESCTGGLIASYLTEISGCSDVFECGFIPYSNTAKITLVGVKQETVALYGAVSDRTAIEMAEGGIRYSKANLSVAVTGIAGSKENKTEKNIGLVHMAVAFLGQETLHYKAQFGNIGRHAIRRETVGQALALVLDVLSNNVEVNRV